MLVHNLDLDQTALMDRPYDERRGREETVAEERPNPRLILDATLFVGYSAGVPAFRKVEDTTPTSTELATGQPETEPPGEAVQLEDEASRACDARVALLARSLEGSLSAEDSARLQILTQRLRRLVPRVTGEDLEQLSQACRVSLSLSIVEAPSAT
ncbi:MAG: hypothetical protein JW940_25575 [Polyangiaceae bacterium]|nr:hypothetical protein [Polyangiaceae bacterium]